MVRHKSVVLGVSVLEATGFVYRASSLDSSEVKFISGHRPWGNKPVYSVLGLGDMLAPLSDLPALLKANIFSESEVVV